MKTNVTGLKQCFFFSPCSPCVSLLSLYLNPKRNQSHTTSKYQFPNAQQRSSLVSHYWPVTFVFRFASLFRTPFVSPSQSVFSGFHSVNSPHFVIPDSVRFTVSVRFSGLLRNREFLAHQAFSPTNESLS